jgi:hypothetical protein
VQSVFNTPASGVPQTSDLNPPGDLLGLGQHALRHARRFARERKSFFWWYIGLYNFLYILGMPFGTALLATVLILVAICLVYGVIRAIREPQAPLLASSANAAALPYANAPRPSQWSLMPPAHAAATQTQPVGVVMRPVVGNLTLGIFHQDACEWAQKIPQKNRVAFPTPAVAHAAGYRACQVCFAPARQPTY